MAQLELSKYTYNELLFALLCIGKPTFGYRDQLEAAVEKYPQCKTYLEQGHICVKTRVRLKRKVTNKKPYDEGTTGIVAEWWGAPAGKNYGVVFQTGSREFLDLFDIERV